MRRCRVQAREVSGVGGQDFVVCDRKAAAIARSAALRAVSGARASTCEACARGGGGALQVLGGFGLDVHAWISEPLCRSAVVGPVLVQSKHQVVAVDDLVAATPAQDRFDLVRAMAGDAFGVGAGIGGQAAASGRAVRRRARRPDRHARMRPRRRARRPAAANGRAASARAAPASTTSAPSGASAPAIQRLRAERPSGVGRNQVQRAPFSSAVSGRSVWPIGDRHRAACLGRDARRHQLGAHAAGGIAGRRLAAHRLDLRGDGRTTGMCAAAGSRRGSAV